MPPTSNIWTQMGYVPPQGPCFQKDSLLTPRCPCLRFMVHPLKVTTSFECDGCGHHASFHGMENPAEEAAIARRAVESQNTSAAATAGAGSRKRPRQAIEATDIDMAAGRRGRSHRTLLDIMTDHTRAAVAARPPGAGNGEASGTTGDGFTTRIIDLSADNADHELAKLDLLLNARSRT
ncbi:hypothetical protein EJ06DRAFT_546888 [Trichodelitschia bisporula]|uniref:Uncharacterized protein n=1 Tax=Trichodelitschia bisporula TaxID=703511 RepID=A0A6G1I6Y4_9PEZI|nr:hypothetical protein EJ06DRAFT_546888 [Trichodelitschia bisporula]